MTLETLCRIITSANVAFLHPLKIHIHKEIKCINMYQMIDYCLEYIATFVFSVSRMTAKVR